MPVSFWIKRFLTIFAMAGVALLLVYLARGQTLAAALPEAAQWAAIVASIVVATRLYRLRKGQRCEVCKDSPEDH